MLEKDIKKASKKIEKIIKEINKKTKTKEVEFSILSIREVNDILFCFVETYDTTKDKMYFCKVCFTKQETEKKIVLKEKILQGINKYLYDIKGFVLKNKN